MFTNLGKSLALGMAVLCSAAVAAQVQTHCFKQVLLKPSITTPQDINTAMGAPTSKKVENGVVVLEYDFVGKIRVVRPQGTVERPIESYSVIVSGNVPREVRNAFELERLQIRVFFGPDQRLMKVDSFAVF
jgi:hypothetical protein